MSEGQMKSLRSEHEAAVSELERAAASAAEAHGRAMAQTEARLKVEHDRVVVQLQGEMDVQVGTLRSEHVVAVAEHEGAASAMEEAHKRAVASMQARQKEDHDRRVAELQSEAEAQMAALRSEHATVVGLSLIHI